MSRANAKKTRYALSGSTIRKLRGKLARTPAGPELLPLFDRMNLVIDEHVKHVLEHQEGCITKMVQVAERLRPRGKDAR